MKGEIYAGLKNALERGSSLEEAIQTFINAGYNPREVREAGKMISGEVSDIVFQDQYQQSSIVEDKLLPPMPSPESPTAKRSKFAILAIIVVILILIVVASFLVYVILARK